MSRKEITSVSDVLEQRRKEVASRRASSSTPPTAAADPASNCRHLGAATGDERRCGTCKGSTRIKLFGCAIHGACTTHKQLDGLACCSGCPDHSDLPLPLADVGILPGGLARSRQQFNGSLLPFRGRLLLAYRTGWCGSHLWLTEVDPATYQPLGESQPLYLTHPLCVGGREDPRLFVHREQLHLAFVGVRKVKEDGSTQGQQLFARLGNDLSVEHVWHPGYEHQQKWEKNWQPFSHDGELFALYHMRPWTVLHFAGDRAYPFSAATVQLPWTAGEPRGGAPPVRVGDEYWSWFHGTHKQHKTALYTVGVCTFAARPPFQPLRCTRTPVMMPSAGDMPDRPGEPGVPWYANVVFPGGAYLDGERWVVSYGYQDHWCRVAEFDHAEIERRLCPV